MSKKNLLSPYVSRSHTFIKSYFSCEIIEPNVNNHMLLLNKFSLLYTQLYFGNKQHNYVYLFLFVRHFTLTHKYKMWYVTKCNTWAHA
jgi:hypothetical protein